MIRRKVNIPIKLSDNLTFLETWHESSDYQICLFKYNEFDVKVILKNWRIPTHRIIQFTNGKIKMTETFIPVYKLNRLEEMLKALEDGLLFSLPH